jgi:hypothetical protein
MDQAGVDRALIHPVLWDPRKPSGAGGGSGRGRPDQNGKIFHTVAHTAKAQGSADRFGPTVAKIISQDA